jgi:hypothetical protein
VEPVRRALGVFIAAVSAMSFATTVQAAPPNDPTARARAALERALDILEGQANDPRAATMVLRDLSISLADLPPAERRLAEELLARPTDSGSSAQHYDVARKYFRKRCEPNYCVHWVVRGRHAPSSSTWINKVVSAMNRVWNTEVIDLAYRKPKNDSSSGGHRGGNPNGRIDIFVADVGRQGIYGYCTSDDPARGSRSDVSAYCVVDDDFVRSQFPSGAAGVKALKVTLAHEFQHAVQFAYDFREDRWFMEGTATNMEAVVYPGIPDNYQYFPSSPLRSRNGTTNGPWWPIDMFDPNRLNQYGVWIFFRFLCEDATSSTHPITVEPDCAIVREIWEAAAAVEGTLDGGQYSTEAVIAALGARGKTFGDVFRRFGVANARPAAWYKNGSDYPAAGHVVYVPIGPGSWLGQAVDMFHMSNDYTRLVPGEGANSASISVDLPNTSTGSMATALVIYTNGTFTEHPFTLNASGDGTVAGLDFNPSTVSRIILIYTNGGTSFSNCGSDNSFPVFSCRGVSDNDSTLGYDFSIVVS